jgi:hypothetical protein
MSYVMQNGSETFCIELPLAHKRIETPVFVLKFTLQRVDKDQRQSERGKYIDSIQYCSSSLYFVFYFICHVS